MAKDKRPPQRRREPDTQEINRTADETQQNLQRDGLTPDALQAMLGAQQRAAQPPQSAQEPIPAAQVLAGAERNSARRMTQERVRRAMDTLLKYKAGKARLESRLVEVEQWWKLRHWEWMQEKGVKGDMQTASAWLFNVIISKHADGIQSIPEANVLPREESDRETAQSLSAIIPCVLEQNEFELIRQFYDLPRQFRITGEMGDEQFLSFDNRSMQPQAQGVDFGMDMGYRLPTFDVKVSAQSNGGLRIQSFSDFEVVHLIDMMQVITDMAQVGLSGQAYTKVPNFAEAMGRTGLKINLSLIAKGEGVDADGNLIFDDIEGMPAEDAFRLRKKYSKNVGTVLVGKSDAHIRAALADPRIDFVIPFHKSGWSESLFRDYLDLPQGFADEFDAAVADIRATLEQGGTDIPVNRMTAEQLKTLSNMIRTINTAVRKANSFLANRRYQTVSGAAQDSIRTLSRLGAKSVRNAILEKAGGFLDWTNATPYYVFKRFGDGGKAVFEGLMDGWDRLVFNSRRLIDYANSCYTTEQVRAWS